MTKHKQPGSAFATRSKPLQCINPNTAGLDIGASSIFVCAGLADGTRETREFLTFTADLKALAGWLKQSGIRSVAMESTGVYWIPVYDILAEAGFEVLLVNAHHVKTVPGRKTDVKDCEWIQQLHSYGLLQGSFRPDDKGVTLRTYVRQRTRLFESAAVQVQLMHKALTQMNLQLNHVISDITGSTGMRIIRAIVDGERDPIKLAALRDFRCKAQSNEIAKALEGNFRRELVFALKQSVAAYDFFHSQIMTCENEIRTLLESPTSEDLNQNGPKMTQGEQITKKCSQRKTSCNRSPYHFDVVNILKHKLGVDLTEVPGCDANTVVKLLGEIGTDMSCWPTVKHFTSWLGLCPGNKISGGKILSSRTKPSANKAAQALRLAASTLYRSKTALGAFFRRLKARLGAPKAITATAHKLAKILYNMMKNRANFIEAGQEQYEHRYRERVVANLRRRATEMGYKLIAASAQG